MLDVRHLRPQQPRAAGQILGILGGVFFVVGGGLLLSGQPGVGLGLGLIGIISLAIAFVKASDSDPGSYTIGEGPDAVFATPPVDLISPDAFELARLGRVGAAGLRFTPTMTGEISMEGRSYTLQEWVREGRAIAEHGVFGTTLPAGARCRLQHGNLVFHIAVVQAAVSSVGRSEVDVPFLAISAATFVGLGSLLVLAQMAAPASAHLDLEDHARGRRFVGYVQQPSVFRMPSTIPRVPEPQRVAQTRPKPQPVSRPAPSSEPDAAAVPSLPADSVAQPRRGVSRSRGKSPSILGDRSVSAAAALMGRGTGPTERAAKAGILAYVDTSVLDNEYAGAFSPDADDKAMWQAMKDKDPMATPVAGLGLIGKGRGGGPGSTKGMVGSKPQAESEERETRSLVVRVGRATERGPRTAADVRSVVVKHVRGLRRCYGTGVDEDAGLRGRITLELQIDAAGDVARASVARGRFADPTVTDCMARAARTWSFPATDVQRRSVVSVPVTLSPG